MCYPRIQHCDYGLDANPKLVNVPHIIHCSYKLRNKTQICKKHRLNGSKNLKHEPSKTRLDFFSSALFTFTVKGINTRWTLIEKTRYKQSTKKPFMAQFLSKNCKDVLTPFEYQNRF